MLKYILLCFCILLLLFVVGGIITVLSYIFLQTLQVNLYQQTGEVLYSSDLIITLGVCVALFSCVMFLMITTHLKAFHKIVWKNSETNKKWFRELLKRLMLILVVCSLPFLAGFQMYVKLHDNYIKASGWSFINNEKCYSYEDVVIKQKRVRGLIKYDLIFPDKKRVFNIIEQHTVVEKIRNKQMNHVDSLQKNSNASNNC